MPACVAIKVKDFTILGVNGLEVALPWRAPEGGIGQSKYSFRCVTLRNAVSFQLDLLVVCSVGLKHIRDR